MRSALWTTSTSPSIPPSIARGSTNWPPVIREQRDALLVGPPGVGKSHLAQAIGIEAIKAGFLVLYRSVFDLVRELSLEATQAGESRLLGKYLKPDLLIID